MISGDEQTADVVFRGSVEFTGTSLLDEDVEPASRNEPEFEVESRHARPIA